MGKGRQKKRKKIEEHRKKKEGEKRKKQGRRKTEERSKKEKERRQNEERKKSRKHGKKGARRARLILIYPTSRSTAHGGKYVYNCNNSRGAPRRRMKLGGAKSGLCPLA